MLLSSQRILCKWKYSCSADLLFYWFAFNQTSQSIEFFFKNAPIHVMICLLYSFVSRFMKWINCFAKKYSASFSLFLSFQYSWQRIKIAIDWILTAEILYTGDLSEIHFFFTRENLDYAVWCRPKDRGVRVLETSLIIATTAKCSDLF